MKTTPHLTDTEINELDELLGAGSADYRAFYPSAVEYDAKDGSLKFLDQLELIFGDRDV